MSRRHRAEKRDVIPDPKFEDNVLSEIHEQHYAGWKKICC